MLAMRHFELPGELNSDLCSCNLMSLMFIMFIGIQKSNLILLWSHAGMILWFCFESNLFSVLFVMWFVDFDSNLLKGRQGKAWEVIHKQALDPSDSLRRAGQKWFQQQTSLHKTLTVSSDKGVKTLIVRCSSCSSCSKQWCFSNREGQFHGFPVVVVCYVKGHHYEATASLEAWGIRATAAKKMNPEPRDRKELVSLQGFNPNFGAQPVCATWKEIEFECSLLPHARRWQQGSLKFEFNFFDPGTKSFQNAEVSLAHFEGLKGEICLHHPKHQF